MRMFTCALVHSGVSGSGINSWEAQNRNSAGNGGTGGLVANVSQAVNNTNIGANLIARRVF